MPRNVAIIWMYPPSTAIGTPLAPTDFDQVEIDWRVAGNANWTRLANVAAPASQFDQPQVDFGTYDFRARAVMPDGRASPWLERLGIKITDTSAPVVMAGLEIVPQ